MEGNVTGNTSALRRAEVYSQLILDTIEDNFLPVEISRDISDFQDGDNYNVPTLGDVEVRDLNEDEDIPIDVLDTGNLTLQITRHRGSGLALSDKQREDSYLEAEFDASFVPKQLRAIKENFETDLLAVAQQQTIADPNEINGTAHRFIASGTNNTLTLEDFIYAKLSMSKAELPDEGRIAVFDSINEASLNSIANLVTVDSNPKFEGLVNTGFARSQRFMFNIFGFDIYVSERLPRVASETIDATGITIPPPGGSGAPVVLATEGIVGQFMCLADETISPFMHAWRRMPRVRGYRNERRERDEFYTTARWGTGLQRAQSLVTVITNAALYT